MNINRDNCEMYFLLYVDNELSAEERAAVERFVAENADLKAELESLISATLPAEKFGFAAKGLLYKDEPVSEAVKEKMLLHLDNELDMQAAASLESNIFADGILKREWTVLLQTKLDPSEKIIFKDKSSLYRREGKKVVSMPNWGRIAAAAAIIGIGLFIGISFFNNNTGTQPVAIGNTNEQPADKTLAGGRSNTGIAQSNATGKSQLTGNESNGDEHMPDNITKENGSRQKANEVNGLATHSIKDHSTRVKHLTAAGQQKAAGSIPLVKKETNNLPIPYFENINNHPGNITASSNVQDNKKGFTDKKEPMDEEKIIVAKNEKNDIKNFEDVPLTETPNSYAKAAVLDESASETSNSSILFMSTEKVSRSKVGGLFKKVKRVVERNVNIKGGNSLKIAGFEIAAK